VVPGKKYKPEDFLWMAWRRRWVILVPLVVLSIGSFLWAQTLPNRYKSEATIQIVPPAVSSQVARPLVNESLTTRLDSLRQTVLRRSNLEGIINELDLYPQLRKAKFMEEIVAQMQRDVNMEVTKPKGRKEVPNQFTISYSSPNPRTAQEVAQKLTSLFVDQHLRDRQDASVSTTTFVQAQLDEMRNRVEEQQRLVDQYREAHNGSLPNQVGANTQYIQGAQQQIQSLTDSIGRDSDRRNMLEQLIADAISTPVILPAPKSSDGTVAQQLEAARAQLRALELRLTPDHPDIGIAKRKIKELEDKAEAEALQQPVSGGTSALTPAESARQTRLVQMRAELEGINRRIAASQQRINELEGAIAARHAMVDAAATTESELGGLERDLATYQASYESLLKKDQDAKMSASIERREVGEKFLILDPARLPERPSGPDRTRYSLLGVGTGLGIGLVLAALLEYRDTSLRTEDDVIVALSLPVVALVPTMRSAGEHRRSLRQRLLMGSAVVLSVVLVATVFVFRSRLVDLWTR
jgi:protein tyrosine kinase modulator